MNDTRALDATTLRVERILPGPIERIWEYLTDGRKRALWFCGGESVPAQAGGTFQMVFDHSQLSAEPYPPEFEKYRGARFPVKVLRHEPPHHLAYTWGDETEGDSQVSFDLAAHGRDVLLVITHSKVVDRDAMVNYASGWHAHLNVLEDRLAGREPRGFWTAHSQATQDFGRSLPQAA